jgi:hypothetical protein
VSADAAALALLERLAATPRAAGSAEEAQARGACAEFLKAHGFETREMLFSYSTLAGRWGVSIVGALWLMGGLTALAAGVGGRGQLTAGVAFALVIIGGATSLVLSRSVNGGRLGRREGTNLIATRGADPAIWLCAHLDTKSQGVPTLTRTAALATAAASAGALAILYVSYGVAGRETGPAWLIAGTLLASSAAVMLACVVGNASPGAADNASGVAAVLSTAAETGHTALGVLLTSAEELGLAGARAWASAIAAQGRGPRLIINCDTLDDEGSMRCVVHHRRDRWLGAELALVGAATGTPIRTTRHTPGIMVDSAALAAHGLSAVTLSRVTLDTLRRIHTPRDTADRLNGDGAERAAAMLTAFVREHA